MESTRVSIECVFYRNRSERDSGGAHEFFAIIVIISSLFMGKRIKREFLNPKP